MLPPNLANDAPESVLPELDPQAANPIPDPLEACLLFLADHHARGMSLAALRAGVSRTESRWQVEDFIQAIESLGFSTRTVSSAEPLTPVGNLPILLVGYEGEANVLIAAHGSDEFEVFSPLVGHTLMMSRDELTSAYAGRCVLVEPPLRVPASESGTPRGRRGHWFWGPILLARPLHMRAGLASVLTSVFALTTSVFSMIVYDRVIPNGAIDTLKALLGGVAIVLVSDFIIRTLRGYFLDVAGSRADVEIADAIFDQVLDIDLSAKRGTTGALSSVLKEYESVRDFFTSATLATLIDLPFALLFIVVLYLIGGPMAWVPLLALPLIVGAGLVLQPRLARQATVSEEDSQAKQAVLIETLNGLETIKSLGAGAVMRRRWQDAVSHQARLGLKTRLLGQIATNWTNMVFMSSQIAVVTVGVYLAADGKIGSGAIVAASILCGRAVQPFAQLSQLMMRANQAMAAYHSLSRIMAQKREHMPDQIRAPHDQLGGAIELRDVTFRYPGQKTPVLDGVSISIEAGERVAILGRVGCGKSTLVKLLLGMYTPESGAVMVGGNDVRQIDPADLRRNIGSVLQEVWLVSGTLLRNLSLGSHRPSDAQLRRVSKLAGVHDWARTHADGYQMRVSERGEGLSGGQRQTVAIARALLGDPPILVMDEPTSAMDAMAERALIDRIKTHLSGKTIVLITHKPSMLELVDKVIVIDQGKVVAAGPKDQVLRGAQPSAPPRPNVEMMKRAAA